MFEMIDLKFFNINTTNMNKHELNKTFKVHVESTRRQMNFRNGQVFFFFFVFFVLFLF